MGQRIVDSLSLFLQGVQAYFSGHEHNLQYLHLDASQLHYIVSGGGSKTDYFPETYWDNGGSLFQHQGSGKGSPPCGDMHTRELQVVGFQIKVRHVLVSQRTAIHDTDYQTVVRKEVAGACLFCVPFKVSDLSFWPCRLCVLQADPPISGVRLLGNCDFRASFIHQHFPARRQLSPGAIPGILQQCSSGLEGFPGKCSWTLLLSAGKVR